MQCPVLKDVFRTLVLVASMTESIHSKAVLEVYWGSSLVAAVVWDSGSVRRYRKGCKGCCGPAYSCSDSIATIPPIFYLNHDSLDFDILGFVLHSNFYLPFATAAIGENSAHNLD